MQVTEIKKIGKGQRYYLVLDEYNKFVIEAEILARHKIKTFDEIDSEKLNQILLENGDLAAFDRAISYLEKNIKTEKGIRQYLAQKGFLEESVDKAVDKLKEYGYINDELFAESYIRTYSSKKGKKLLAYELSIKGVDKQIIDEKIEELVDNELASCIEILTKYTKGKENNLKTRQKAYAYLAGKGFSSDVINQAIREILCEQV